jgi:hypothetical protein
MATITDRKDEAMHTITWTDLRFIGEEPNRFAIAGEFTVYERLMPKPGQDIRDAHIRFDVSTQIEGDEVIIAKGIFHDEVMRIVRGEQAWA